MKGDVILFNTAGSSSIQQVDSQKSIYDAHTLPMDGTKNSVTKSYSDGKLEQERYYDSNGKAYLDIDYTDHGNPKMHPVVPHLHHITWNGKKPRRGKWEEVK